MPVFHVFSVAASQMSARASSEKHNVTYTSHTSSDRISLVENADVKKKKKKVTFSFYVATSATSVGASEPPALPCCTHTRTGSRENRSGSLG